MSNEELVSLIKAGENATDNTAALYLQMKRWIYKLARRYSGYCEMDDLMQEAYFGLVDAINHFDTDKGYTFTTYATHWLTQRMGRYSRNNSHLKRVPIHQQEMIAKYRHFVNEYKAEHDSEPEAAAILQHMGISEKQLIAIETTILEANVQSFDDVIAGAESLTVGETLDDGQCLADLVEERVDVERMKGSVWQAVAELPEQQKNILERHYKKDKAIADVRKQTGFTGERIRQIEHDAFQRLRKNPIMQDAAKFFYGEGSLANKMYVYGLKRFKQTGVSSTEFVATANIEREEKRKAGGALSAIMDLL